MLERWRVFWFSPSSATNLGLCRVLACALFLWTRRYADYSVWATIPDVFWMPIPLFRWFGIPVFPLHILSALGVVWKVALLTTMVGLWTRPSAAVACLVGGYLLGLPQNFGKTHHSTTIIPLILLIFTASRCGDAWSMDRLMQRAQRPHESPAPSGEYTWPIRLVWLLTALVFFAAGVAKLRHAGLAWVTTDSMANILLSHHYQGHEPHGRIGLLLAGNPWAYKSMAAAAMLAETLVPLALFNRMARCVLIPGLFAMLLAFPYLFGFTFVAFYSLFIFWIPWDRPGRRCDGRAQPR